LINVEHIRTVKIVESFDELITTPFAGGINALCWRRSLEGNFDEVAKALQQTDDMVTVNDQDLLELKLSPSGQLACKTLMSDQCLLRDIDLSPSLDSIFKYPVSESDDPVSTDVYSFHVDSCPVEVDTYLCSYNIVGSEGLCNLEAMRCIDQLSTRRQLLKQYGGEDDKGFRLFLRDKCYDLHYLPSSPGIQPYSFGIGHLWRLATQWPGSRVLPCIHRAPVWSSVDVPRLLLIS